LLGGTYNFTIFKPDGCILDEYQATLNTLPCENIKFPNTFTPNNDGVNDVFLPNQDATAANFKWKIFTRYGTPVFYSEDPRKGWNGEHNGKPVSVGVYYWLATYLNNLGKPATKSGSVTLIR
jgi:gliding motility-associated-like protein